MSLNSLPAAIRICPLFSDNMVILQNTAVPVWGTAEPGQGVEVIFSGQRKRTTADASGRWSVKLDPLPASDRPQELIVHPTDTGATGSKTSRAAKLAMTNVLVGEVWLASGQSNMEYAVTTSLNHEAEIAAAHYPAIRFFQVKTKVEAEPVHTLEGQWAVCTPETVPQFSATAYYFARDLHKAIRVPVGIIQSAESGTLAEAWSSREVLESDPDFQPILDRYARALAEYPAAKKAYEEALSRHNSAAVQAHDAGGKQAHHEALAAPPSVPAKEPPAPPVDPALATTHPSGLFNGKIMPLIPYAIRGIIWWQGEYNSERGEQYRKLFPALIRNWRSHWQKPDLPFLFVQLQNLDIEPQPNPAHYDELRDAQLLTLKTVPHTGMAVACDVGDPKNIHPPNKQAVGARLSLIARGMVYGDKGLVYSGPIYRDYRVEVNAIRIHFDHIADGLVARGGQPLASFEIAAADRKFVPAQAVIDKNEVVVRSADVSAPVAVRYAWRDNPTCSLDNSAGLPASPFRTDDWPLASAGNN